MSVFLGIVGFLGFLAFLIILIVAAFRKRSKKFWAICTTVCFVLFIFGVATDSDSHNLPNQVAVQPTVDTTRSTSAPTPTPAPVIKISAAALYQDYRDNEIAADIKYKGQLLEIAGIIDNIGDDILGTPYVSLRTGQYSIAGVQCMFKTSDRPALAKLSKGQSVTIRGTGDGYLFSVLVRGSSLN